MKPVWEVYEVEDSLSQMWVLDGPILKRPIVFSSMSTMFKYIESFHWESKERTSPTKGFRSGDSATPKHPYDRPDEFWEAPNG